MFTNEKRESIKLYILEQIDNNNSNIAKLTSEKLQISLNTVYRYIREMISNNIIARDSSSKSKLKLIEKTKLVNYKASDPLEEDRVYINDVEEYIKNFPLNVRTIWEYSFMEMFNNAIDHSEASNIHWYIVQNYLNTTIIIGDNGVGIFEKIKKYYEFTSINDAISELFKGKLTTDKEKHSGEGIFFTSRILDTFCVLSDGKIFTHNSYTDILENLEDIESLKEWNDKPGTEIVMSLSNWTKKNLKEVFDMYSNDDGQFIRTQIPIKNMFENGYPVSRSQAKRLCRRFDCFKEITLDFKDITEIGQGFAHELFVVFKRAHPDIKINIVNESENVRKMINHVTLG